jgi:2-amino-4-hydroxy-6-hydroxymethyldihydropteridine diphosphokinase
VRVAIGLGSNLGSRLAYLRAAVDALEATPGVRVLARSRVYETKPVGPPQPDYHNAVVLARTTLEPAELLAACKAVERALGRERGEPWGPRVIDLDLVVSDAGAVALGDLVLPHPLAATRAFVLAPLADVWPGAEIGGRPVAELLAAAGGVPGPASDFALHGDVTVVEHTADVALRVAAPDEADLLAAAGDGLADLVLDRAAVAGQSRVDFEVRGATPEDRLVALLSEIVGRFDADALAPRRTLVRTIDGETVRASIWGETFDPARHGAKTAVKAATYHALRVERTAGGLVCTVTLDL